MNPEKRELWLEYANLECLYIVKIMERRRILGLDKIEDLVEETGDLDQDEITLPTITENDLQKAEGPRLDPLLTSPLTDVSTNPALNGAIPMAVYSSAIASRPDDISLLVGFYDVFVQFYPTLRFAELALNTVKQYLVEKFPGHGKTLLIQIRDQVRGVKPTDRQYPAAFRRMMKTAAAIPTLSVKERKQCCMGLLQYLDDVDQTAGLDENLQRVVNIFQGRVKGWQSQEG